MKSNRQLKEKFKKSKMKKNENYFEKKNNSKISSLYIENQFMSGVIDMCN